MARYSDAHGPAAAPVPDGRSPAGPGAPFGHREQRSGRHQRPGAHPTGHRRTAFRKPPGRRRPRAGPTRATVAEAGSGALRTIAILPAMLIVLFAILYFQQKGKVAEKL